MKNLKKIVALLCALALMFTCAACGGKTEAPATEAPAAPAAPAEEAKEQVVLEFAQWWEPECGGTNMVDYIAEFEKENPDIKIELLTNPYVGTHDTLVTGAATGTMPDVVGLDGAWVYDLVQMDALMPLDTFINSEEKFAPADIATVDVAATPYMIPVVVYVYGLYTNLDILKEAGIEKIPETWSEFLEVCKKVNDPDNNIYGWMSSLASAYPSSAGDQFLSWAWSHGADIYTDKAVFGSDEAVKATAEFFQECYEAGVMNPGLFSMTPSDMTDNFTNGYAAFMTHNSAAIAAMRASNPDLNFTIAPIPLPDDYADDRGVMYVPWGIGISKNTEHPEEAWRFVSYIMEAENNSAFAKIANALPGNNKSSVDSQDEAFLGSFAVYQSGTLINELQGLPQAEDLQKNMASEIQAAMLGDQDMATALTNSEGYWNEQLG